MTRWVESLVHDAGAVYAGTLDRETFETRNAALLGGTAEEARGRRAPAQAPPEQPAPRPHGERSACEASLDGEGETIPGMATPGGTAGAHKAALERELTKVRKAKGQAQRKMGATHDGHGRKTWHGEERTGAKRVPSVREMTRDAARFRPKAPARSGGQGRTPQSAEREHQGPERTLERVAEPA